jgi:hypothetical protein
MSQLPLESSRIRSLKAGAPKKRKDVYWDPELKEKVHGLILSSDYDWTTKAKLSPAQLKANEKVLDILEGLSRLESGPLHIGHILRILEDETAVPFPNPGIEVQQKLGRDMTIKDVLMRLPISLWPPAYPSKCFHPECGKSKTQMCKTDHQNKDHDRKRDLINNIYQKLNGSYLFDGESCSTATTASLLNATVIAPVKAACSDAYKVGMGIEKQLNAIGDLQNTWLKEGRAEWHGQVGDFWGPILSNLQSGGGWLSISEEIFNTGAEHRFYPKEISENDSWRRCPHSEQREDDDPAQVLFDQVGATYRGRDFADFAISQLVDVHKIHARAERHRLPEERNQEDEERQDRELEHVLDLDTPPEPVAVTVDVSDWDMEVANTWNNFSGCLEKSSLNQRVSAESLVRYRRAQWTQMSKEQRDTYTVWKTQRYVVRKLIKSRSEI